MNTTTTIPGDKGKTLTEIRPSAIVRQTGKSIALHLQYATADGREASQTCWLPRAAFDANGALRHSGFWRGVAMLDERMQRRGFAARRGVAINEPEIVPLRR